MSDNNLYDSFRKFQKCIDIALVKGINDKDYYEFYQELDKIFSTENGLSFKIYYPYKSLSIERKISFIEGVNLESEEGKVIQKIFNVFLINGIHTQEYRPINSTIEKNGLFFAILFNYIENQVVYEDRTKYFTRFLLKEDKNTSLIEIFDILLDQEFQFNDLNLCHINFEGFRDQTTTFRQKLFEIKNILYQEKKSKEEILKTLEDYFFEIDNSQFLGIFIHVFLFCYIQFLSFEKKKFCHIKMKSLSDIYYYLLLIAFIDDLKINFHCLQAISNYFNLRINYVDMNSNTPNFISIYPVFNNYINEQSILIPNSKLLSVNLATFKDKIYIFYSSSFCYEIKNIAKSEEENKQKTQKFLVDTTDLIVKNSIFMNKLSNKQPVNKNLISENINLIGNLIERMKVAKNFQSDEKVKIDQCYNDFLKLNPNLILNKINQMNNY